MRNCGTCIHWDAVEGDACDSPCDVEGGDFTGVSTPEFYTCPLWEPADDGAAGAFAEAVSVAEAVR